MRPIDRIPRPSRESSAEDIRQRLRELPSELQPPFDWAEFRRRGRARRLPVRSAVKWEHAAAAAGITVLIASLAMWVRVEHQGTGIAPSGVGAAPSAVSSPPSAASRSSEPERNGAGGREPMSTFDPLQEPDVVPGGEGAPVARGGPVSGNPPAAPADHSAAPERSLAARAAVQATVASQLAALGRGAGSARWLAEQPEEPVLVRVAPRVFVANLEDRIAWVDDTLSDARFAPVNAAHLQALQQERARLVSSLAQVRYAETLAAHAP